MLYILLINSNIILNKKVLHHHLRPPVTIIFFYWSERSTCDERSNLDRPLFWSERSAFNQRSKIRQATIGPSEVRVTSGANLSRPLFLVINLLLLFSCRRCSKPQKGLSQGFKILHGLLTISDHVDWGPKEGLACTDPEARAPIGTSGIIKTFFRHYHIPFFFM